MARAASSTATPRKSAARGSRKAAVAAEPVEVIEAAPAHAVLRLDADMTVVHAAAQREQILAAVQTATQGLELDLSAVDSIDSAGIQLVLAARHSLKRQGVALTLSQPQAAVNDALGVYGLHPLLANGAPE
jgi:anti-sigma B factor antagonist